MSALSVVRPSFDEHRQLAIEGGDWREYIALFSTSYWQKAFGELPGFTEMGNLELHECCDLNGCFMQGLSEEALMDRLFSFLLGESMGGLLLPRPQPLKVAVFKHVVLFLTAVGRSFAIV
jgi:hypothetical protein